MFMSLLVIERFDLVGAFSMLSYRIGFALKKDRNFFSTKIKYENQDPDSVPDDRYAVFNRSEYAVSDGSRYVVSSFRPEQYQEYDLAHLKLVFEFSIYTVWKSVRYGISKELDTAYWGFLGVGTDTSYLP
ncbi:hypothetical protein Tco_0569329 [Tanacetum coccineum]